MAELDGDFLSNRADDATAFDRSIIASFAEPHALSSLPRAIGRTGRGFFRRHLGVGIADSLFLSSLERIGLRINWYGVMLPKELEEGALNILLVPAQPFYEQPGMRVESLLERFDKLWANVLS